MNKRSNTVVLKLKVNKFTGDALEWYAAHGYLGCTAEEVATYLLVVAMDKRLQADEPEKIVKFNQWLDRQLRSAER